MQQFYSQPLVDINGNFTALLGADKDHPLVSADLGKGVKLAASGSCTDAVETYVVCSAGDEIEGTVEAISAAKIAGGFSYGTVNNRGRRLAKVITSTVALGDKVVADTSAALGTANEGNKIYVKGGSPTTHVWRVVSLRGAAGANLSTVTIERVNA